MRLQICIWAIIIGLVVEKHACYKYEELDVLVLRMYKYELTKSAVMFIEEKYFIADRGGATYYGELGHGFKPAVSIYKTIWCVIECQFLWNG